MTNDGHGMGFKGSGQRREVVVWGQVVVVVGGGIRSDTRRRLLQQRRGTRGLCPQSSSRGVTGGQHE